MKRFISYVLCLLIAIFTITGCSHSKNEVSYEDVIKTIISPTTYTKMSIGDGDKDEKQYEKIFKDYLTKDALKKFEINTILCIYEDFFKQNEIANVKDITINEIKNEKIDKGIYIECKSNYVCEINGESVNMEDYYIINLSKDGNSTKVSKIVLRETSSIYKQLYKRSL